MPHVNYGLRAWKNTNTKADESYIFNCTFLKHYYKLYRNTLPIYFENFLPENGTPHYPLRYAGIHMPVANREFCKLNAKYQLHFLLH